MPTISVIITCYNEGNKLLEAINSLEQQNDRDFDLYIINDASQDIRTNEICRDVEKKYTVIRHKHNGGLSEARNTGFKAAKGEIVVPLDADDVLPYNAISLIRQYFIKYPEVGFAFGNYSIHNTETKETNIVDTSFFCDNKALLDAKKLLKGYKLLGTSPCKKITWEKVGGYRNEFGNTLQDMDFWYRVLEMDIKGIHIPQVIYQWNKSESGMNSMVKSSEYMYLKLMHLDFISANNEDPKSMKKEVVEQVYTYTKNLENENEKLKKMVSTYKNSASYKLGNLLLKPLNIFKK